MKEKHHNFEQLSFDFTAPLIDDVNTIEAARKRGEELAKQALSLVVDPRIADETPSDENRRLYQISIEQNNVTEDNVDDLESDTADSHSKKKEPLNPEGRSKGALVAQKRADAAFIRSQFSRGRGPDY